MTKTLFTLPNSSWYRHPTSQSFTILHIKSKYNNHNLCESHYLFPGQIYFVVDLPCGTYEYKFVINSKNKYEDWYSTPDALVQTIVVEEVCMQICDICFNQVENIKLSCGHKICSSCLDNIVNNSTDKILCPFCRGIVLENYGFKSKTTSFVSNSIDEDLYWTSDDNDMGFGLFD